MIPMKILRQSFVALAALPLSAFAAETRPNIDYVDPFIGTMGGGNVYPGATLPFGFIQVSPDTGPGSGAGGYKFDKKITGFSQQHISGMGGPLFGQISLFPLTGELKDPSNLSATGKSDESASPGYYTVTIAPWDVKVELTATKHVALHRHTFPANDESRLVLDVGHVLYGTGSSWGTAKPIGGEVTIDAEAREISGFMVYQGARGNSRTWKVFFAARFDAPFETFGTWDDAGQLAAGSDRSAGSEIGAFLTFPTTAGQVVNSKVAISWRSLDQASGYFESEAPAWDFDGTRERARAEWVKILDTIDVEGGTADQRTQFFTALYRIHVTPNDWTGEAPERYGDGTYYENILCMWDTFRTVHPLLTLLQPKINADIINTIIRYHQVDGWTGDAHSAWTYEHVQNGSHADAIIADAYVKKLPGVDWKQAYEAIRKNAFEDANPDAKGRPNKGRFRLDDYRKHGYLPSDVVPEYKSIQSVSRTLEYVQNDANVLTLAREFGTKEDIADLEKRQLWYHNLWDAEAGGFMRGKKSDGTWHAPFDPLKTETGPQYYEGHAWTWSWYVPHDAQGLINLHGGPEPFVEKLTIACDEHYEAYNEPGMLQTYLFIHAGRPDLTQRFVRQALRYFSSKPNGLPGNDDSGTTSAWLLWALMGLYPNAGEDYYYIGSPSFTKTTLHLGNGKTFVISAPAASPENKYVSAATLDGKPWDQAWLRHADVINGGELSLTMTAEPSKWGTRVLPPSASKAP